MEEIKAESSRIISKPPQITFKTDVVSPPNTIYIDATDFLAIFFTANTAPITFNVTLRIIKADSTVALIIIPVNVTAARAGFIQIAPLTEGFLASAEVALQGQAPPVMVAVSLRLSNPTGTLVDRAVILSGKVIGGSVLYFAGIPNVRSSLEGPGALRIIATTDPAAGAEISETVPALTRWRFIAMRATLVTDATVATRTPQLQFDDGANVFYSQESLYGQAASLSYIYTGSAMGTFGLVNTNRNPIPTPPDMILGPGFRIRTSTLSLQAGDNWSQPILYVEEWLEDT